MNVDQCFGSILTWIQEFAVKDSLRTQQEKTVVIGTLSTENGILAKLIGKVLETKRVKRVAHPSEENIWVQISGNYKP